MEGTQGAAGIIGMGGRLESEWVAGLPRNTQESTKRQYVLQQKAVTLGWDTVRIVDSERDDFCVYREW